MDKVDQRNPFKWDKVAFKSVSVRGPSQSFVLPSLDKPWPDMPVSLFRALASDVLDRIVVLCCSSSLLEPPRGLLSLLLTCRWFRDTLSIRARPELYADIFVTAFDIAAPRRRFITLNASFVADELVHRYTVLHRVRNVDVSDKHVVTDLWTIYLMILESDGLNERQLNAACALPFIVECMRQYLPHGAMRRLSDSNVTQVRSLSLWSFWLLVTYGVFAPRLQI
jgi:hypothetical protein